jgi:hypothetical protein
MNTGRIKYQVLELTLLLLAGGFYCIQYCYEEYTGAAPTTVTITAS